MNESICTVALIGAGKMAEEHIKVFSDIPNVKIVGIHSRTPQRAKHLASKYHISHVCDSISELYARTNALLVVNAVSIESLKPTSLECFAFPWTILLEKPVGCNFGEAEEILAANKQSKNTVLVGLNRRFLSSTKAVLDDIKEKTEKRFIHVQDQENQEDAVNSGFSPKVADNWMYGNAIHLIDYFALLGRGNIHKVTPICPWQPGKSHVVVAHIEFTSGDIGIYEGIWNGPGPWAVSINLPDKRWNLCPLEQASFQLLGERQQHFIDLHPWDRQFKPGLRAQAQNAVSVALDTTTQSLLPNLADAMKTMKLIHLIFGQ